MKTTGKIICWVLGIVAVIVIGVYLLDSRPKFPPAGDDWLTEWEAYEDQTAHTGMDGGALVVPGLRIRDPRDVCREEEYYIPDKYAIRNGSFKMLQSGEEIYVRYADALERRSVWVHHNNKCYFVDESGCKAHDIYAFDGFYAGSDGSWDMDIPRLKDETRAVNGKRYREDTFPKGYLQFEMADDGTGYVQRVASGVRERYQITPFGRGTYALQSVTDSLIRAHLALLPDGHTALLSQAGDTRRYSIKD